MQFIGLGTLLIVNHEQLLSAVEAIDGSTYFNGLEYEHFFNLQAKYF